MSIDGKTELSQTLITFPDWAKKNILNYVLARASNETLIMPIIPITVEEDSNCNLMGNATKRDIAVKIYDALKMLQQEQCLLHEQLFERTKLHI